MYDYVIAGAGLYGAVIANELKRAGRKVVVLERADRVGGNCATSRVNGVHVHDHGPHIFHTKNRAVWDYVNGLTEWWPYRHHVKARVGDRIYTLPFNMATYYEMWGCTTPAEAEAELIRQRESIEWPTNLEEQALATIGRDLYHTLVYGYTKKQWGRSPKDLPASIIRRIPLRMTFNSEYFDDWYQGIPVQGYSHLIQQCLDGVDVRTSTPVESGDWKSLGQKLIYSGSLDELYGYRYGPLAYRGLRFESISWSGSFQGLAQMNYPSEDVPYTRIVEHKHFHPCPGVVSMVTYEHPVAWEPGMPRYYPVGDAANRALYRRYREMADVGGIIVGGRLGAYQYMDMDTTVAQALREAARLLGGAHDV